MTPAPSGTPAAFAAALRARERLVGYWSVLDSPVSNERIARLGYLGGVPASPGVRQEQVAELHDRRAGCPAAPESRASGHPAPSESVSLRRRPGPRAPGPGGGPVRSPAAGNPRRPCR